MVLHDVLGVTEHAEDVCRRLARDGWLAVSPYLYYKRGGPAFDADDLSVARREMERLRADDLAVDLNGAVSYLRGKGLTESGPTGGGLTGGGLTGGGVTGGGVSRVAVVGFSMGGYLATWAAAHLDVTAAVAVSPSGAGEAPWDGLPPLEKLLAGRHAPWLGLLGERDEQTIATVPVDSVVTVPGAAHGFYRAGLAPALWQRIAAFLDQARIEVPAQRCSPGGSHP
ncbi:dienelactone hydrolase family protein [Actinomadura sp. 9N407]|uniref:dienelactone hydrolase family protein n=1 Tax=Actinomadura sp. 9N407 TaxID=3375154 RepID=UPI0037B4D7C9